MKNLRRLFQRIIVIDAKQFREQKGRKENADAEEKQILKTEIADEAEKLNIENAILEFERRLDQYLASFNNNLRLTVDLIRGSSYPYDAKPSLSNAQLVLKQILDILNAIKALEERLIGLIKKQEGLLKREKQIA